MKLDEPGFLCNLFYGNGCWGVDFPAKRSVNGPMPDRRGWCTDCFELQQMTGRAGREAAITGLLSRRPYAPGSRAHRDMFVLLPIPY